MKRLTVGELEEITTESYGCVFYCNRTCNLDGDWCVEGPGCPKEIDPGTAKHLLELAQAEKDGRLVVLPPNAPLTREQLDKLNQEPIWIVRGEGEGRWALVRFANKYGISTYGCGFLSFEDWQVDWWAYRCKPEAALKKREEG